MRWVVTSEEMRALDRETIETLGIPGAVLMEHAGRAVADEALGLSHAGGRVAILCGAGNNGGDGYVAARWLREAGRDARVYLCAGRPKAGGDAAANLAIWEKLGGPVVDVGDAATLAKHAEEIGHAAVIVDALLGTGLRKEVTGHLADVIELGNHARATRVAVDVPSGLDADTGRVLGVCVQAHRTVTFGFLKVGLVSHPGFERAGQVRVVDIAIPHALPPQRGVRLALVDDGDVSIVVPPRERGAHKGSHGHLLLVAGQAGKSGAAVLATLGALRGGAGLVTVATDPATRAVVQQRAIEAMAADVSLDEPDALRRLDLLVQDKRAIAFGPGIPTSPAARERARAFVASAELPMVLDADALNHLAPEPELLRAARAPVVITPHPGEAARLLDSTAAAIQGDRVAAARKLAERSGAVVALKGARTIVAAPDGQARINPTGNPGMASGGTGDVLCGLIGALLAQGLDAFDAAVAGVFLHGRAGDLAAARRGERGLLARDVARSLPEAFLSLFQAP